MRETKAIASETLNAIIRRVVEVAKPDKIILFGSAARDQIGANSDVDLLVIKSGNFTGGI
jgi:predicted nucleotidyltransferase